MAGFRFGLRCSLSLLMALVFVPIGRTQTNALPATNPNDVTGAAIGTALGALVGHSTSGKAVNKVYSLADLGDDPNLCKWIAETIPQMIKPGCWHGQNICYYAPAKVMAINQTPEVHAQIEEFLANMRKSLPRDKTTASRTKHDAHVAPAQFNAEALRPVGPASASQAYPVPAALPTPKHLFHFIIRYEGAGIIDSNVTKFTQALTSAAGMNGNSSSPQSVAVPVPLPSTGSLMPSAYDEGYVEMVPHPVNAPRTMPPADSKLPTPTSGAPVSNFYPPPPPPFSSRTKM